MMIKTNSCTQTWTHLRINNKITTITEEEDEEDIFHGEEEVADEAEI